MPLIKMKPTPQHQPGDVPGVLRASSDTPDWGKPGCRACGTEPERLVEGERPGHVRPRV